MHATRSSDEVGRFWRSDLALDVPRFSRIHAVPPSIIESGTGLKISAEQHRQLF